MWLSPDHARQVEYVRNTGAAGAADEAWLSDPVEYVRNTGKAGEVGKVGEVVYATDLDLQPGRYRQTPNATFPTTPPKCGVNSVYFLEQP